MIDNRYFNILINNPLKTWWKARKYFKLPKIRIHKIGKLIHKKIHTQFGDYVDDGLAYCPYACLDSIGKILSVYSADVMWKDKWNSPRHERNPIIWILLFKRIGFCITFNITYLGEFGEEQSGDMQYWEFLLSYLYYTNNLKSALLTSNGWTVGSKLWKCRVKYGKAEDGSEDVYEPQKMVIQAQLFSLNKKGLTRLKSII